MVFNGFNHGSLSGITRCICLIMQPYGVVSPAVLHMTPPTSDVIRFGPEKSPWGGPSNFPSPLV